MKKRIIAAILAMACAVMMFAATPAAVAAAETPEVSAAGTLKGAEAYITGPTTVEKGATATYEHWNIQYHWDGTEETFSNSANFPETVSWSIDSTVAAGTTLTNDNGYGVLNVATDETAGVIVISAYDSHFKLTRTFKVYVAGNEANIPSSSSAPSDADPFWLGVHSALTKGSKAVTVNADGFTFVPFYVLDALRGKNATLTITCGLDDYVISGRNMKNLRAGASYSFGNLADILNVKADPNSRGGVTYSTQK